MGALELSNFYLVIFHYFQLAQFKKRVEALEKANSGNPTKSPKTRGAKKRIEGKAKCSLPKEEKNDRQRTAAKKRKAAKMTDDEFDQKANELKETNARLKAELEELAGQKERKPDDGMRKKEKGGPRTRSRKEDATESEEELLDRLKIKKKK